jgi:hypothetical protein
MTLIAYTLTLLPLPDSYLVDLRLMQGSSGAAPNVQVLLPARQDSNPHLNRRCISRSSFKMVHRIFAPFASQRQHG